MLEILIQNQKAKRRNPKKTHRPKSRILKAKLRIKKKLASNRRNSRKFKTKNSQERNLEINLKCNPSVWS